MPLEKLELVGCNNEVTALQSDHYNGGVYRIYMYMYYIYLHVQVHVYHNTLPVHLQRNRMLHVSCFF